MRRVAQIVAHFLVGVFASATHAAGDYVYYNCADQQSGIPLVDCATLTVDETLSHVMIIDNGTSSLEAKEDPDYFAVRSPLLPLAAPRHDYVKVSEWSFRGVSFKKIHRNFSVSLLGKKITADIISATQHGKVTMTFWYSDSSGILAIGFPGNSQSGTVYFCSGSPCLFAN